MENFGGGFTDAGDWKLLITISAEGMNAYMKSKDNTRREIMPLFSRTWNVEEKDILKEIENTVYDNPRILDDFSTELIINTPQSLWLPSVIIEEDDSLDKYFNCVYDCDEEDIMTDSEEEITNGYFLVSGLNSFIRRTLPGCKVYSHLTVLKDYFKAIAKRDSHIFVNINAETAEIIAFDNGKLISGAVHEWKAPADIAYNLYLLIDAYGLDQKEIKIGVMSADEYVAKNEVKKTVEKTVPEIYIMDFPSMEGNLKITDLSTVISLSK